MSPTPLDNLNAHRDLLAYASTEPRFDTSLRMYCLREKLDCPPFSGVTELDPGCALTRAFGALYPGEDSSARAFGLYHAHPIAGLQIFTVLVVSQTGRFLSVSNDGASYCGVLSDATYTRNVSLDVNAVFMDCWGLAMWQKEVWERWSLEGDQLKWNGSRRFHLTPLAGVRECLGRFHVWVPDDQSGGIKPMNPIDAFLAQYDGR